MGAEFFEVHGYPSLFSSRDERSEGYRARRKIFDVSKKPKERASHDEKSECCGVRAENSDASFVWVPDELSNVSHFASKQQSEISSPTEVYFVRGRAISGFSGFLGIFCYFFAGGEDSPSSILKIRRWNQHRVRCGLVQNLKMSKKSGDLRKISQNFFSFYFHFSFYFSFYFHFIMHFSCISLKKFNDF